MGPRAIPALIVGTIFIGLATSWFVGSSHGERRGADPTPTPSSYLPIVASFNARCPVTSTHAYQSGTALQFDHDDPVRPAEDHADKNLEVRGYVITQDAELGLVDYGCDDDQMPPQIATLFRPVRVPSLTAAYRVHDWIWSDPPDPGERGAPIAQPEVTALGLKTNPGETIRVPRSGYDIGGGMEALVLFADEDTVALRYTREDSSASPGYTVHLDNLCTDPNLLALYRELDDIEGPRYRYPSPSYALPNVYAGQPIGVARGTPIVAAIVDTGTFQDPRSLNEWWQIRPGLSWADRLRRRRVRPSSQGETSVSSSAPALGNIPDRLAFTYSRLDERLIPSAHQVTPLSIGSDTPMTWSLTSDGDWFTLSPTSGTTPRPFSITPTTYDVSVPVTHTGAVTVTITDPEDAEGLPSTIDLALRVRDLSFSWFGLPLVLHDYSTPAVQVRHPNDPLFPNQWNLSRIAAPRAWSGSLGGSVLIAVLDTGLDLDHPDLEQKALTDSDVDFVNGDLEADDDHGHGTHVAGIAAAATDNAAGIAGVGWNAAILPIKVLTPTSNGSATGTVVDLANAIVYAADHGADIINLSLGAPELLCSADTDDVPLVRHAIRYAYHEKGILIVAAGGNHPAAEEMFPANCDGVLGVSATDLEDNVTPYSSVGSHISVAAPGGTYSCPTCAIYSTDVGGGYALVQGTSMSAPHVAGVAALLFARYPGYTPGHVASAMLDRAVDLGALGWDEVYGCGRIDAAASLLAGAAGPEPLCQQEVIFSKSVEGGPVAQSVPDVRFVPGEILVRLRPGRELPADLKRHEGTAQRLDALKAWRVEVPVGHERAILAQLRSDPAVLHAGLNYYVFAQ